MLRSECSFCEHMNPEDSMYCNRCGGPLRLAQCPGCDAWNDRDAQSCRKCAAALAPLERSAAGAIACAAGSTLDRTAPRESTTRPLGLDIDSPPPDAGAATAFSTDGSFAFAGSRAPATKGVALSRFGVALTVCILIATTFYFYYSSIDVPQQFPLAGKVEADQTPSSVNPQGNVKSPLSEASAQEPPRASLQASGAGHSAASVVLPFAAAGHDAINGANNATGRDRCVEQVAALGLCAPQALQRR
jgi:hypothetical protein